jgi:hypothetical protein
MERETKDYEVWETSANIGYDYIMDLTVRIIKEMLFYMVQLPPHIIVQSYMMVIYSYLDAYNISIEEKKKIIDASFEYAKRNIERLRNDLAEKGITI